MPVNLTSRCWDYSIIGWTKFSWTVATLMFLSVENFRKTVGSEKGGIALRRSLKLFNNSTNVNPTKEGKNFKFILFLDIAG